MDLCAFIFSTTWSSKPSASVGRDFVSVAKAMLIAAPAREGFGGDWPAVEAGDAEAICLAGSGLCAGGVEAFIAGDVIAGGGGGTIVGARAAVFGAAGITMSGSVVFALSVASALTFGAACTDFGSGAVMATLAGGATTGAGILATLGALGADAATRAGAGTADGPVVLGVEGAGGGLTLAAVTVVLRTAGNVGGR